MALRRMAARRGWPRHLYSDNGTNLRGADKELQKSMQGLNNEELKAEAANNGMEFRFIPPLSPHWGGAWERLVRSIKTSLRVIFVVFKMRSKTPLKQDCFIAVYTVVRINHICEYPPNKMNTLQFSPLKDYEDTQKKLKTNTYLCNVPTY